MAAVQPRTAGVEPGGGRAQIGLVALVQVLAMAPWFAAAAATPSMAAEWGRSASELSWLTSAVQLGFVGGAVGMAWFGVPDRVPPARLLPLGASLAALATAVPALVGAPFAVVLACRAVTGAALATVYPPGIRVAASWTVRFRGTAVALLVGALTLGSAVPRLAPTDPPLAWRTTFLLAAGSAVVAALLATRLRLGPHARPAPRFDPRRAREVFTVPRQRRPALGYIGHMWELYAFWTWLPALTEQASVSSPLVTPFAIAGLAGALGSLGAGVLADRVGRDRVARGALLVSGVCCLASPLVPVLPLWALAVFLLVWGAAVVGDSPLWSAMLGDASPPDSVGTALTVQTAAGFATTVASIALLPVIASAISWRLAFTTLAIGPALGLLASRDRGARPAT